MVKYVFREDGPVLVKNRAKADPQKLGEALDKARRETPQGQDMRATAIEHARNRRNALHPHLEWDDPAAAHQYRLIQINQLICSIRVEDDTTGEQRPAFVSVTPSDGRKRFATPSEIVGSLEMQIATLRAAENDLAAWQKRFRMLGDLCQEVEAAKRRLAERRASMEERSAAAA